MVLEDDPQLVILNKTRTESLVALFGLDPDGWTGKTIVMKPEPTTVGRTIIIYPYHRDDEEKESAPQVVTGQTVR